MSPLLKIKITAVLFLLLFNGCNVIDELKREPEIAPLRRGLKASAGIGYCASLAAMAFEGKPLPDNVIFEESSNTEYSGSGLIYLNIDENSPLPFNDHNGQVIIGGLWDHQSGGGVISIIFGDFDLLNADFNFYGIHTVPVIKKKDTEDILTVFAEQDLVMGSGADTIINLGLSRTIFDAELERLDSRQPDDVFVAIKQNVWFINVDQQNTFPDIYDDSYRVNGGGQIVSANNSSGGILYHALINTEFSYHRCPVNPSDGVAFMQNIKAGDGVDLGNITLNFHSTCDGQAKVAFATGKYSFSNGKNVDLAF